MQYWKLRYEFDTKAERRRVVRNIKELREFLSQTVPPQTTDSNVILGTWNLRNFDDNRFGDGPRLPESFFYIAEIVSAFDAIAIQEVCGDLRPLQKLMSILGPEYDFIFTDVTEGKSGNTERLGFIFNRDKVAFKGIAGEIVLPDRLLISSKEKRLQFARTPFAIELQARWLKFTFATVHIYYGASSKTSSAYKRRVKEIQQIANFLSKRADQEAQTRENNYILVGDFNIDALGDDAYNALEESGFQVFKNREGSNRKRTKYYDQISFKETPGQVVLSSPKQGLESHGVLSAFDVVFRDDQFSDYDGMVKFTLKEKKKSLKLKHAASKNIRQKKKLQKQIDDVTELQRTRSDREKYYREVWRTFQLSDHLPLWVDLRADFADDYLDALA